MLHDIHRSVSLCGLGRLDRRSGTAAGGTLVVSEHGASIHGVMSCHSAWACPHCSPRLATARAESLAPQVAALMADQWSAWLITLTVRHSRDMRLDDLWEVLATAWGRVTSGREWNAFRRAFDERPQFVRGLDLTWSPEHGWHPHLHLSLFLPPGGAKADAEWLLRRWQEELAKLGFDALDGAQYCERARSAEAATAYAATPATVYETVGMAKKETRQGQKKPGMTPFEILENAVQDYRNGEVGSHWVALWREYVAATKGRRQVTTSRGLRLKPDNELALEGIDEVAVLGGNTIGELDRLDMTADVLDAAESSEDVDERRAAVAEVLAALDARDWHIRQPQAPVPCSARAGGEGLNLKDVPRPDASNTPWRATERMGGAEQPGATHSPLL